MNSLQIRTRSNHHWRALVVLLVPAITLALAVVMTLGISANEADPTCR